MLTRELIWITMPLLTETGVPYASPVVEARIRTFYDGMAVREESVLLADSPDSPLGRIAQRNGRTEWHEADVKEAAIDAILNPPATATPAGD